MAKPEAEHGGGAGGRCWASLLALGVALAATAALALCVAYLDATRREHIGVLEVRLKKLETQLEGLQARLENVTVNVPAARKDAVYEEEVYEYDEDNSYEEEYDEDEEDEPNPKTAVKRTAVLGEGRPARARREVRAVPVRDERLTETIPNHKKPTQGSQRTVANQQNATPNYQEQRRAPETTVKCRHRCRERNRNGKLAEFSGEEYSPDSQPCNILAAQFVGSASKYNTRDHPYYYGNHILHHPTGSFEAWEPADWMVNHTAHFPLHRGRLTIQKPGVYLIYAQVYYVTIHDHSGFHIKHNGHEVAQCTTTTLTKTDRRPEEWMRKHNTCFTAVALRLAKRDEVWLSEVEGHRNTSFRPHHSYFGLIQLTPTPT